MAAIGARRRIETPAGALWAAASVAGLRELRWSAPQEQVGLRCDAFASANVDSADAQLAGYF